MSTRASIFYGGEPAAAPDPDDRGLAYGDGVFETLRFAAGRPVWWAEHWSRLARGAAVLGIPLPDADWVAGQARALMPAAGAGVLKLVLTRGPGGRGYASPQPPRPGLLLWVHALPPPPPAEGLRLRWCRLRLAAQPALAGIKHLNRLEQVLARGEWSDPEIHEGLLRDRSGRVICATAANLFVRLDGRWWTPPLRTCGVAGICRGWLLAEGLAAERVLGPAEVLAAEAVFLCNSVRGILPVSGLEDRRWPPHPETGNLTRHLAQCEPAFAAERDE